MTQAEPVWSHQFVTVDGLRLHYVEAGQGPLVILLHGFPEHWYSWRHQLPALAKAGFRTIALDLPGYNLSDKPPGTLPYRIENLAQTVAGCITACGEDRAAAIVGHDWGGIVGWHLAMQQPSSMERLIVLNTPHPQRMRRGLIDPRQFLRSSYILAFQLPLLPEWALRRQDFAAVRTALKKQPIRPNAITAEDIERYVEALRRPGTLTSALNYYRAYVQQSSLRIQHLRPVDVPALVIWGDRDRFLRAQLAEPDRRWVPNARVHRIREASHWVQQDRPEEVNKLMLAFLSDSGDHESTSPTSDQPL